MDKTMILNLMHGALVETISHIAASVKLIIYQVLIEVLLNAVIWTIFLIIVTSMDHVLVNQFTIA